MSISLYNPMVQFIHKAYCIEPSYLERVDISLLPNGRIKRIAQDLKPRIGECYYNSARLALELHSRGIEATYVVGVANLPGGIPAGHGWVEVDGSSYDSTLELGCGTVASDYFAIERYGHDELLDFLCQKNGLPPSFPDDIDADKKDFYWRTERLNHAMRKIRATA